MTLPKFTEITSTTVSDCLGEDRPLITTNSLIDEVRGGDYFYKYATGTKTGCTGDDQAIVLFQQQFMRAIHIYALRSVQTIQKTANNSKTVL